MSRIRRTGRTDTAADPELVHRLSRRNMLGVAAGATAAALLGAAAPAAAAATADPASRGQGHGRPVLPPGRLGIQLYSLRDKVATLGFAAVFEELQKYGYDEVEYAGYSQGAAGALTLAELKRLTRDHGLRAIGSHVGYYASDPAAYTFAQNLDQVLDDAAALGLPHIGTASGPWRYGSTVDGWKRCAEEFNRFGAEARKRGMKFYQHNHSEEFSSPPTAPTSGSTTSSSPRPTPSSCTWRWTSFGRTSASTATPSVRTAPPRPSTPSTTSSPSPTATRSST
ncbi:hypothetical protein STANM309S_04199 [Streptomyces tanashiensis]